MLARPSLLRYALLSSRFRFNTLKPRIARTSFFKFYSTESATALSEARSDDADADELKPETNRNRRRQTKYRWNRRTGKEFSEKRANLGVNTLGEPAEVLILRDTEQ